MADGKPPLLAFTNKYNGITRVLPGDIDLAEPFDAKDPPPKPSWFRYKCIWDTGASGSVITSKVVTALNLQPTGKVLCHTAGGEAEQNTYLVAIMLPNNLSFPSVRVTEAPIYGSDALIGMDIISQGDLAITNNGGRTIMSFQWPSNAEIDFVAEINRKKLQHTDPIVSEDEKRKARNKRKS